MKWRNEFDSKIADAAISLAIGKRLRPRGALWVSRVLRVSDYSTALQVRCGEITANVELPREMVEPLNAERIAEYFLRECPTFAAQVELDK